MTKSDKITEKSKANLKPPWQPGESGNPSGRTPGTFGLTKLLKQALQNDQYVVFEGELLDEEGHPTGKFAKVRARMPKAETIVNRVISKASGGDMRAVEFVYDRIEGRAKQTIYSDTTISAGGELENLLSKFIDLKSKKK